MFHLPIILADADPSAADIKTWLLVFSFLANVVLIGINIITKFVGKAEKREITGTVSETPKYITADEFQSLNRERAKNLEDLTKKIDGLHSMIEGVHRHIESAVEKVRTEIASGDQHVHNRVDEVHERINEVSTSAATVVGRFNDHLNEHRNAKPAR
jgi:methyl-accepting chemotaxis protein